MDQKRKIAYDILMDIELKGTYSNIALNRYLEAKDPSAAFVRELVYGVIERKNYLDYFLDILIKKGLKSCQKKLITLLRMGAYQIEFMDAIPSYAAVDETVNLTKEVAKGKSNFVNAVLRNYIRKRKNIPLPVRADDEARYLSIVYSAGLSQVKMLISQYGKDNAEKILQFSNRRPPVCIRVNLMKTDAHELADKLGKIGIETRKSDLSGRVLLAKGPAIASTPFYKAGEYTIMSEESCFIADRTRVEPGDTVIDLCAAPGEKTCAIAEMIDDVGQIIAMDIHPHRVDLIRKEIERLGLKSIRTIEGNAELFHEDFKGIADKVLCDVPCSGLGVMRRKPELKYIDMEDDFIGLRRTQLSILEQAATYLKPEGKIIYSTCTLNKAENTELIREFLKRHTDFGIMEERLISPFEDDKDGFYLAILSLRS